MKRYLNTVRKESSQFFSQSDDTRHNDEVEKKETTVKKIFFHFLLLYVASRALRRDKLSSTFLHFISLSLSHSLTYVLHAYNFKYPPTINASFFADFSLSVFARK
jgi:hypothetical protein